MGSMSDLMAVPQSRDFVVVVVPDLIINERSSESLMKLTRWKDD